MPVFISVSVVVCYILNLKSDYMTGFSLERMVEGMRVRVRTKGDQCVSDGVQCEIAP
jgi:hypothetical protein